MSIISADIGQEFKREMTEWFNNYPEVVHVWSENELVIKNPKLKEKDVVCRFSKDKVIVSNPEKSKTFKKELFEKVPSVISNIFVYIFKGLIKEEDRKIHRPTISKQSFAVLHSNQKYGQILTVNLNLFVGWGEVYKIFENLIEAKKYCESMVSEDLELSIYDSNYNCIKQYR